MRFIAVGSAGRDPLARRVGGGLAMDDLAVYEDWGVLWQVRTEGFS